MSRKPRLFIASSIESLNVAEAVNVNLDHECEITIWKNGTFNLSSTAIEDLVKKTSAVDFALFILTPDDLAIIRNNNEKVVRDNVLFEMGLFIGKIGKDRSFILKPRNQEMHLPTDIMGLIPADYEANREDNDLVSATNRACSLIKTEITKKGPINHSHEGFNNYYGVRHIVPSFPRDNFKLKIERSKDKIRFFNTWVPCLDEFETSIVEALKKGVDVEILLLHPDSQIVKLRDETLRAVNIDNHNPYNRVERGIRDNFDSISRIAKHMKEKSTKGELHFRLYNTVPAISIFSVDNTIYVSVFAHGNLAIDNPQIVMVDEKSDMKEFVIKEYNMIWSCPSICRPVTDLTNITDDELSRISKEFEHERD